MVEIVPTGFGGAAADYARHRAGVPAALFERLEWFGVGSPGQVVIDLGTGTGTIARQLAARGCLVTGIDPDPRMSAEAQRLGAEDAVDVDYRTATAEETGLDSAAADVVIAGQCWHWFDRPAAVREARRVLRSDGCLVITHFDWIPSPGSAVAVTERLIETHNPRWTMGGGHGMWPQWVPDVEAGGFRGVETFGFDVMVPYSHESWRGRIRASAGVTALDDASRDRFDAELAAELAVRFPSPHLEMQHRVWTMVARAPGHPDLAVR